MAVGLVEATIEDVAEYIRIATLNASRFNVTLTNPEEVAAEIRNAKVYLIKDTGRTVGIISYVMLNPERAYISEVQVEPAYREKGIGGKALRTVIMKLRGVKTIELLTHPGSPAQHLYRRCGFERAGDIIENYDGTGEPRMRMLLVPQ